MREPKLNPSPSPGDAVHATTCYMCACRCGIKVWTLDGRIRYIQGNPDHPVNRGVLCAKGSAGIMMEQARELGANAVVGVDLDYETIQVEDGGSMLMVSASGTAVVIE